MDLMYILVFGFIRLYKFFYWCIVKCMGRIVNKIFLRKMEAIGVNVVIAPPGTVNDMIKKEKTNYETSKKIGTKPTITIYNEKFFERIASERGMGLGETYLDGWWDCDSLDELARIFLKENMMGYIKFPMDKLIHYLEYEFFNEQTRDKSYKVAKVHYDLGDNLFESFLDPSMTYTCAYWRNAKDLEQAQEHKMDLIARKMKLKPGMRVLEMGCGWGGFAKFLAERYQVSVVACNIAKEGAKAAAKKCKGLPVEVRCCDYRDMEGKFDRVVAVGMMEHVGPQNHRSFVELANRCLDDNGLFLIHTIGMDNNDLMRNEPFLNEYIFPNGNLPQATEITKAFSGLFVMEDWQNIGPDYDKTLMAWYYNFIKSWPSMRHQYKDPNRFYRLWTYYFLMPAGGFRSRRMQLYQIVLTKNGWPGTYDSVR